MEVLIKILFEFDRFFQFQNVVKMSNPFQYKLKGGLYPDAFFLRVDGPINEGGGGSYNRTLTVLAIQMTSR